MGAEATRAADERLHFAGSPLAATSPGELALPKRRPGLPVPIPSSIAATTISPLRALSGLAETERERGTGFLLLPVFMGLGAIAYFVAPIEPAWTMVGLVLMISAALAFVTPSRPALQALAVAVLMIAVGALAAKIETWRAGTTITGSAVTTRITGRVLAVEQRENGRIRLTLDLLATQRPELRYPPERLRVTARHVPHGTEPGAVVTGLARLMPPSGPVRPNSYDFAFESYFDRLGAIGFFLGDPELSEQVPVAGITGRIANGVERLRLAIAARVRARLDGPAGEIAAALIAGIRSGIPEDINEALRRTGLAHVLSISGLHMALVAGTVMVSMRTIFALFPGISARRPVKKYAAGIALAASAAYLAISGAEVAAQRSFIMLAVMLVALLFDRAALTLRNLAIAAFVVLAMSPHEVMGPSFQMSFAATAALIGGYAAWSDWRSGKPSAGFKQGGIVQLAARRTAIFFIGLAATSVMAGLATTIYGVYHFSRVSPYGLHANMLAMPLVSLTVMPMVVVSALLMPFGLEGLPLDLMGWGIDRMVAVATWFSERSPIDAVGTISPASLAVMTLALLAATLFSTRLRLVSLPLVLVGAGMIMDRRLPDALISEDARLIALRTADGGLAINRTRPNGFTFDNWTMALAATGKRNPAKTAQPESDTFVCEDDVCTARHVSGALVVFAPDPAAAAGYCGRAALIVLDDATARGVCAGTKTAVVTKRDTARKGSAAVYFARRDVAARDEAGAAGATGAEAGDGAPETARPSVPVALTAVAPLIRFSLAEPYRPWHEHRRYSREARGLPPYRREKDGD